MKVKGRKNRTRKKEIEREKKEKAMKNCELKRAEKRWKRVKVLREEKEKGMKKVEPKEKWKKNWQKKK